MISLSTITEKAYLKRIWNDLRDAERKAHLTEATLIKDSTGGIAFQTTLSECLSYLRLRLLTGYYKPHSPHTVQAAKSKLLHRRFHYLIPEDAIIYSALVKASRSGIIKQMSQWVNFGRLDNQPSSTSDTSIELEYEYWWTKWLRYRKLLKIIESDPNKFLVISDVANFFGSVDRSILQSRLSGITTLDINARELLFEFLNQISTSPDYRPYSPIGLPVVSDDSSRILAHFYLKELDDEFRIEGARNRYTRWVDDLVVSVPTETEGAYVIGRIEKALAKLGLIANGSKTSVITKRDFKKLHFESENDFLDRIHESTEENLPAILNAQKKQFERRLKRFLKPREGYWTRLLRRYYTESRRIISKLLLAEWCKHLEEYPPEARHILDYLIYNPGSISTIFDLYSSLRKSSFLYEDVQILIYECILSIPLGNDLVLRSFIVHQTYLHMLGKQGYREPNGYLKGLQALTIFKFGSAKSLKPLSNIFKDAALESPDFVSYALPVLCTEPSPGKKALIAIEQMEDPRILRIKSLVERLETGDRITVGMLLSLLEPRKTRYPSRFIVNARSLPLLKIARRTSSQAQLQRITSKTDSIIRKINSTSDKNLIDQVSLEHLK